MSKQNRVILIVTRDLETNEIRVSIGTGNDDLKDKKIRIAGPKFEMSSVEEILVEDLEVSELLNKIKEVQVKREKWYYE